MAGRLVVVEVVTVRVRGVEVQCPSRSGEGGGGGVNTNIGTPTAAMSAANYGQFVSSQGNTYVPGLQVRHVWLLVGNTCPTSHVRILS